VTSLNYSIYRSVVYRDLDSINSLSIKKIDYFAFKLSFSIKNYSLEDSIIVNNVFLNK
jgi:hypothetical protein